jgi:hypothetical protein
MVAALALAAIAGAGIFKFGVPGPFNEIKIGPRRGAVRKPADDDDIVVSGRPRATGRVSFAQPLERTGESGDRIAEFYSQISRRVPTA